VTASGINQARAAHYKAEIIASAERMECAKLLEMSEPALRLMAGEISPDEMRLVQSILRNRAQAIRNRAQ
jgi:hypothetical protein